MYPDHYFLCTIMTPLKEMFGKSWFTQLASALAGEIKGISREKVIACCMSGIGDLELNQRMRHTSAVLNQFLPGDFDEAAAILKNMIPLMPRGYTNLVFPDYVSQYGISHFRTSMDALEHFTKFGSSEFAIRHFLRNDFERTLEVMQRWAGSSDHHVRRLASEGSRPSLPWSFRLERVIKDPSVTAPILEMLKADRELYVRKSVANHLNDISKFAPDYMLDLVSGWDSSDARTAWIIRHASRTLIKKGHARSLQALHFEKTPKVKLGRLTISSRSISIGDDLDFSFTLQSQKNKSQRLAVDYRIHYVKKNGKSVKTFKLRELTLGPGETVTIRKKQRFTDFSTRRHLPGVHTLEIQLNGKILGTKSFRLTL